MSILKLHKPKNDKIYPQNYRFLIEDSDTPMVEGAIFLGNCLIEEEFPFSKRGNLHYVELAEDEVIPRELYCLTTQKDIIKDRHLKLGTMPNFELIVVDYAEWYNKLSIIHRENDE